MFDPGVCGDGEWGGYESCDDGNQQSGDGCSASCQVESGWLCSDPGEPCRQPTCGDGITDSVWVSGAGGSAGSPGSAGGAPGTGGSFGYYVWEQCDDGNVAPGDGCSASCDLEAGWTCPMPGEPCRQPTCGDGYQDFVPGAGGAGGASGTAAGGAPSTGTGGVFAGTGGTGSVGHYEGCDDGNTTPGDGCSATCEAEAGFICEAPGQPCRQQVCGDGIRDWFPGPGAGGAGGASSGSGGTTASAGFPSTGGTIGGEQCDDGNASPGDGCDANCAIEPGYSCVTPGTPCRAAVCGDGVPDYPIEQCDDGNNVAGDGCFACRYEWWGSGGQTGFTGGARGL